MSALLDTIEACLVEWERKHVVEDTLLLLHQGDTGQDFDKIFDKIHRVMECEDARTFSNLLFILGAVQYLEDFCCRQETSNGQEEETEEDS
jgi:hypothetical protein